MRKIAILCLLALIPLTQMGTATADSANPPKITSVQIITPTPAVIGQILTIEVQYSGGAPGIKQLMIQSYYMSDGSGAMSCWGGIGWSNSQYPQFQSMTRVTAIVGGGNTDACKDDGKPITFVAEITDETNLKDRYQFDLRVTNPFNRIGTISQSRVTDFNVNTYFPNQTISSYNFPFSLELPRVTPEGIPIVYYGNGDCERLIDFINDTGKGIRFLRPGTCQFTSLFGNLKNISYNISVIDKAAADKAAAELKAKQEADAKAAAELKAKQEADAKAAAELKAKQEAEAKAAAELKAKQEAEAIAKAAAAKKKTTITCVKGKLTKKVTAVKPTCPKGYKK